MENMVRAQLVLKIRAHAIVFYEIKNESRPLLVNKPSLMNDDSRETSSLDGVPRQ